MCDWVVLMLASPLTCIQLYFSTLLSALNWCWWSLSPYWSFAPFVLTVYFHVWARRFAAGGLFIRLQYENELQVRTLGTDGRPLSQSRYRLDTSAHLVKQNLSAKGQRRFTFFCCHPGGRALRNASPSAVCRNNTLSESLGESNYGELEQRIEAEPLQGCSL